MSAPRDNSVSILFLKGKGIKGFSNTLSHFAHTLSSNHSTELGLNGKSE